MKLPILNYHGFQGRAGEYAWEGEEIPYVLEAQAFNDQLSEASKRGFYTLRSSELRAWAEGKKSGRAMMFTFDDGLKSHYEHAAPALKRKGYTGIFFIPAGMVGRQTHMNWNELRNLSRDGFEIGSHGLNHVPLTDLTDGELREELETSKKILEEGLGVPVKSFSIPRGFHSGRLAAAAKKAGYEYLYTSRFDLNASEIDLFYLRRMVVKKSTTLNQFINFIEGNLGWRRPWEAMKEKVRGAVPPVFYDRLAAMKRGMP